MGPPSFFFACLCLETPWEKGEGGKKDSPFRRVLKGPKFWHFFETHSLNAQKNRKIEFRLSNLTDLDRQKYCGHFGGFLDSNGAFLREI
jgi:hypothetical protein